MCFVVIIRKELERPHCLPDGRRYAAEGPRPLALPFVAKRRLRGSDTWDNDNLAVHGFSDNRLIHLQLFVTQRTRYGAC